MVDVCPSGIGDKTSCGSVLDNWHDLGYLASRISAANKAGCISIPRWILPNAQLQAYGHQKRKDTMDFVEAAMAGFKGATHGS
jgi:hypothetical protein